jgi:pyruvate dehydrogenase E2 component (dihydrolipoamide acetyltransferase)
VIDFQLPSLGADMDEGTLLQWLVQPGDQVKRGQVIAVVDTSKAAVDVEIWQDGIVADLLVQPGEKVPVGTVLARLHGGSDTALAAKGAQAAQGTKTTDGAVSVEVPPQPSVSDGRLAHNASRHLVSPTARKRAGELGINLAALAGSGVQGSVTLADVEAAGRARDLATKPAAAAPAVQPDASDRQKAMRKAIAAAMSRSKREIPHYYLAEDISMANALAWLQMRNEGLPVAERILPAVMLLKAVALALKRTPQLNGFFRDDAFEPAAAVHAGVAINLRGGGLVAPAIHDVAGKPLQLLMRELTDLVKRARAGSLRSSEMSDPTMTITNLGDQGVACVFGVIYPPQVALVGFGNIAVRPWVDAGVVRALPVLTATLAADHRASNGHTGALFLAELRELLQSPQSWTDI